MSSLYSAVNATLARCVCQRQSSPGFKDVEANTPSIPRASFFAVISSTTAFSVAKLLISWAELISTALSGRAKYCCIIASL